MNSPYTIQRRGLFTFCLIFQDSSVRTYRFVSRSTVEALAKWLNRAYEVGSIDGRYTLKMALRLQPYRWLSSIQQMGYAPQRGESHADCTLRVPCHTPDLELRSNAAWQLGCESAPQGTHA
jgi:hypothetical protein